MKEKMSVLMVLLAATIWGCISIFVRHLTEYGFDAMQMTATKCLINAVLMFLLILATDRKKLRIRMKDIGWFLANGVCSIFIFNSAYHAAINLIPISTAVVLLYTAPMFVTLMSVLFFYEKFTRRKALCLVLCVGGSALVSGLLESGTTTNTLGLLLGLVSGFGYALYSIFSSVIVKKYHPFTNVLYTFLIAGITGAVFCDMEEAVRLAVSSPGALGWTLANGVVTSFLAYVVYTTALQYMNPSKAAILASLEPVVATLVSVFVYREPLSLIGGMGILMVFSALVLSNLPEKHVKNV